MRRTSDEIRKEHHKPEPSHARAVTIELDSWHTVYPKPVLDFTGRYWIPQEPYKMQHGAVVFPPVGQALPSRYDLRRCHDGEPQKPYYTEGCYDDPTPGMYITL